MKIIKLSIAKISTVIALSATLYSNAPTEDQILQIFDQYLTDTIEAAKTAQTQVQQLIAQTQAAQTQAQQVAAQTQSGQAQVYGGAVNAQTFTAGGTTNRQQIDSK